MEQDSIDLMQVDVHDSMCTHVLYILNLGIKLKNIIMLHVCVCITIGCSYSSLSSACIYVIIIIIVCMF